MTLTINGTRLDDPQRPYIVAEMSGNHNQDYATAVALIHAAADAGADAVKTQTFTAEEICADIPFPFGHNATHDAWARGLGVVGMRDLFRIGGLPRAWHKPLKDVAESRGIAFLSTPFSVDAAKFLVEEIGVPALKIASGDLTFTPLLRYAATTGLPVILSTGGATLDEVETALHTINLACMNIIPVAVLHCVSVYPCADMLANLRAIATMREQFFNMALSAPMALGFSDHTLSYDLVSSLAVACGATVLEKHIKLTKDKTSIDAAHSLPPYHFSRYADAARRASAILGHGRKEPHALERHDKLWARRDSSDWLRPTAAARQGAWE